MLTAGCMIGPDFKTPKADVAAQWLEADHDAVDSTRSEYRDWWNVFADPTLRNLIELAYQQNLTLRAAGVHVLQARAELGVALGELWPQQQNVSATVTRNRVPLSTPFLKITDPTYWQDAFGAQAAWEVDVWGKLRRAVQSADWAYLASVAAYDDVLVTLTGDVASTYVQIRVLQAQLAIARENVVRQKQALDIASLRFKAGVATERDVYQAENVLGETEGGGAGGAPRAPDRDERAPRAARAAARADGRAPRHRPDPDRAGSGRRWASRGSAAPSARRPQGRARRGGTMRADRLREGRSPARR
jgi:outer membrane protein TolC